MLVVLFRLRKVRVMSALHGFTRRSFNNVCYSLLMVPEYIYGYSHAAIHSSLCRTTAVANKW